MSIYELKNIDKEDIEDFLLKIEISFNIEFVSDEINNISTFGEFCDLITNKINLENSDDCTSQQAFYKLREAISKTSKISNRISTQLPLSDLFPRKNRRLEITKMEQHLGFKINILQPPQWVIFTLAIFLFLSVIIFFLNWKIGILGLGISIAGFWSVNKFGNETELKTVGEIAEKMKREHYLKSRRNPQTYNRNEIDKVLTEWFSYEFEIDKNKLTRDTKFI